MKETKDISQVIRRLHAPASSKLDERVYDEIAKATAPQNAPSGAEILSLFLKKKSIRYTLVTTLGLVLLVVFALNRSTSSAWAMEQAIEALKKYRAFHVTGYATIGRGTTPLDFWARAEATGNLLETGLVKWGDMTVWNSHNKTYTYDHAHNSVFVEPGITLGLNPWLGPKLLYRLARMKDYKAFEGEDPATGQKRVIATCSAELPTGPHSFLMEFDVRTKLPVSVKGWLNLNQEGPPNWYFEKIIYFEDLPESAFNFQPPAGTPVTDMPLTIPEASLSSLSDPRSGISADGMTQQQACETILNQLSEARAKNDLPRIRQLMPATATWSDKMLRGSGEEAEGAQLLKIGEIERTGRSKLGPLALVPMWFRYKDGAELEVWMIVQFRETEQGTSCVVQGTRGYALNVKK
jgi:hypothetical protein